MAKDRPKHRKHPPDVNEEAITGREEAEPSPEYEGPPVQLDTAMDTDSDEDVPTVEDEFGGEITAQRARRLLQEAESEESEGQGEE